MTEMTVERPELVEDEHLEKIRAEYIEAIEKSKKADAAVHEARKLVETLAHEAAEVARVAWIIGRDYHAAQSDSRESKHIC